MTTLGLGEMYAKNSSLLAHILLSTQVMVGYMIIGALITRFAIMFSGAGPHYKKS